MLHRYFPWILVGILFFSFHSTCLATDPPFGVGARVIGLGKAFTAVRGDVWGLFHNPSTITGGEGIKVGAYYEQRFFLPELTYGNAGAVYNFNQNQAVGISVGSNGFQNYRNNQFGLTYGITVVDKISIGAQLNYAMVSVPDFGNTGALIGDIGVHVQLDESLSIGASMYNVNQANFETTLGVQEAFPTVLTGGIAYQPTDQVLLVADVQKDVDRPISYRGGIEYELNEFLDARIGVSTAPLAVAGGISLHYKELSVDFALSYTEQLQYTPHVSLSYLFDSE